MYGEIIIGINMIFNFAVLSFANKAGNIQAARGRLVSASFAGALPVTFFPHSLPGMIVSFLLMTYVAFGRDFTAWRKAAGIVLVGAFFAGGLLTIYSAQQFKVSSQLSVLVCAALAFISLSVFKAKWLDVRVAKQVDMLISRSCLRLWDVKIPLTVFVDTGNGCKEPMSGSPVHFVSYRAAKDKLPEAVCSALEKWDPKRPSDLDSFPEYARKDIRLIRLSTVQGSSWTAGFRYSDWSIGNTGSLPDGYIVFTREDSRYPNGAEAILHVSAMESILKERGTAHVAKDEKLAVDTNELL